ncbi:MAG: DUF177 domain-containing protein [Elusimicrobiales bacterium]|nr:DUF177 domain-containing protein [Elusimicrobiales bacterium]
MQEKDPLIFNYLDIKEEEGLNLRLEPPVAGYAALFDPPVTLKKVSLELNFTVGLDSIFLEGKASAELEMICARCAEPIVRTFEDSFDEVYPDTVEYIDTREVIRETVGVLAPIKVLCSDSCKGRCLVCGINRNKLVCACRSEKANAFDGLKGLKLPDQDKPGK